MSQAIRRWSASWIWKLKLFTWWADRRELLTWRAIHLIENIGSLLDDEIANEGTEEKVVEAHKVIKNHLREEASDTQGQIQRANVFASACHGRAIFFGIVEELVKEFSVRPDVKRMKKTVSSQVVASAAVGIASATVRSNAFNGKGRSWWSAMGFFPDPVPSDRFLEKKERDEFRASLMSWLKITGENRTEYNGGITVKLDSIYAGEWDYQSVKDITKKVVRGVQEVSLPPISSISNDFDETKSLHNTARGSFMGVMVSSKGLLPAKFQTASALYSASKAFAAGKTELSLEIAKLHEPKVVSTTLNQANLSYISDWDASSMMVLIESFVTRAGTDPSVAKALMSAELFAESGNRDLINCSGCLRSDPCHDSPNAYPGGNKTGCAATVARLVVAQALRGGVKRRGASLCSYSRDGKILKVIFFETVTGCLIPQGSVAMELDATVGCSGIIMTTRRGLAETASNFVNQGISGVEGNWNWFPLWFPSVR